MRIYRVEFERFNGRTWEPNWCQRQVAISGGALAAAAYATKLERKYAERGFKRLRARAVTLVGEAE